MFHLSFSTLTTPLLIQQIQAEETKNKVAVYLKNNNIKGCGGNLFSLSGRITFHIEKNDFLEGFNGIHFKGNVSGVLQDNIIAVPQAGIYCANES